MNVSDNEYGNLPQKGLVLVQSCENPNIDPKQWFVAQA